VPAKVARHIYLFDTSGSLVSVTEGVLTALPTQSSPGFAVQAETTAASSAQDNSGPFKERLKHFQAYLNTQIIGQEAPIDSVCRRLRIAYSGLSHRDGPVAVFLFVGPSGVGKTELAKKVATYLMGGEQLLIRFDMSEYMEEHSVSKLIGSPPGYVGYDKEGQLTGKLRAHPRAVLLLDEVEKAHPRVMDMFLQLFGEGRITDSKGDTVDASKVIVIMTSNIRIQENLRIGFGTASLMRAEVQLDSLKNFFRTELVNRIDNVVMFNRLDRDSIRRIITPMLEEIRTNLLTRYGAALSVSDELIEFLIREGYDPEFGVRKLKRTVEHFIQGGLGELMIHRELKAGDNVTAYMIEGKIAFSLDRCCAAMKPAGIETPAENTSDQVKTIDGLHLGMKVRHAKFGVGTIRKVEGTGEDQKVIVWFNAVGPKKLLTRFAGLVKI
jgi:ATP-dependent Clp protease ATP-binding subunit ClpA